MLKKLFVCLTILFAMTQSAWLRGQTAVLTPYSPSYGCTALPYPISQGHKWATGATYKLSSTVAALRQPFSDLAVVTAHRGYWETCPENSLEAFHAAIDTGVEAVEMDARITKDNVNYIVHDYNLRGEASRFNYVGDQGADLIYALPSSAIIASGRGLVDRHGQLFPSAKSPETRISLENLVTTYVQRETAIASNVGTNPVANQNFRCSNGATLTKQLQRGPLIIFDLKGDDVQAGLPGITPATTTQYKALELAISEVVAVECNSGIDLSLAVAYKISGHSLPSAPIWETLFQEIYPHHPDPLIIPIVFASDFVPGTNGTSFWATMCTYFTSANPCTAISALASGPSALGYDGFVAGDWQLVYPNTTAEPYALAWRQAGGGVAGFMGVNSFPEGFRNSDGTCKASTVQDGYPTLCTSQPVTAVASSSLDYLLPPLTLPGQGGTQTLASNLYRATAITTDWFQDAVSYLTIIGRHNTSHLN